MASDDTPRDRGTFSPTVRDDLESVKVPFKKRTPSSPNETVDTDKLLDAWQMQAATMREVVRVIEKNEANNATMHRSNRRTQAVVVLALVGTLVATAYTTYEAHRVGESMKVVAVAVASLNEVEMLEKEASAATHPVTDGPATAWTPPTPAGPAKALTRARMRSMAKSLEAQARFASDASVAVQVEARTRKLRKRAAANGVELDSL